MERNEDANSTIQTLLNHGSRFIRGKSWKRGSTRSGPSPRDPSWWTGKICLGHVPMWVIMGTHSVFTIVRQLMALERFPVAAKMVLARMLETEVPPAFLQDTPLQATADRSSLEGEG